MAKRRRSTTARPRPRRTERGAATGPRATALERPPSVVARWSGPALVAASAALMVAWSWRGWGDPLIDFGQQLYLAWRVSEGDVLYRDLAYFHGPLAPLWNGLWFRVLGAGMTTLWVLNGVVTVGIVASLHHLIGRVAGRVGAALGGVVFALLFLACHFVGAGNYTYLAPYEHSLTHGLLVSLLALACLGIDLDRRAADPEAGFRWSIAAGALVGTVALTKVEVFLAVAAATGAVLLAAPRGRTGRWRGVLVVTSAALVPVALAWLGFALVLGPGEAAAVLLGPYRAVLAGDAGALALYREGLGTDDLGGNTAALGRWLGAMIAVFGPASWWAWRPRSTGGRRAVWSASITFVGVAALLLVAGSRISWWEAPRVLPVLVAGIVAIVLVTRRRSGATPGRLRLLALAAFALVLLAKMALHVRLYQYGFVLAMPATLLVAVAGVVALPRWLWDQGRHGERLAAVAAAVLVAFTAGHLRLHAARTAARTEIVGVGVDHLLADARGAAVEAARALIERHLGPDDTLVVLPEGVMLDYLTRRRNPTPILNFVPTEFAIFGEERILSALRDAPPDFVLLFHRDTTEFGPRFFGRDYARETMRWIRSTYRETALLGARPLESDRFGLLLLERADRPRR